MSHSISERCTGCGACLRLCPVAAIDGEKKALHVINERLCIECGVCGRICPAQAVEDPFGIVCDRIKRAQWPAPRFELNICMSCCMCVDACPVGCLAMEPVAEPRDGHAYPVLTKPDTCIACGFCARECPVDAVSMAAPAEMHPTTD
jgi:formate hydrogenlyase subunit 6/NADH:ubiquinone oxidoreductase subunit I